MAGRAISLRTEDDHTLSAYEVLPDNHICGCFVLLREIFGVTAHIRRVCEEYAGCGYHVIVPGLFDRVRQSLELDYSTDRAAIGRELRASIPWDHTHAGVAAAVERTRKSGKVATLGYWTPDNCAPPRAPTWRSRCIQASHGFNCDEIANLHEPSAALVLQRTLEFLRVHFRNLGKS